MRREYKFVNVSMDKALSTQIDNFLSKHLYVPFSSFTKTMVTSIVNMPNDTVGAFIQHKYLNIPKEKNMTDKKNAEHSESIKTRLNYLTSIARTYKPSAVVGYATLARYAWRQLLALPPDKQEALLNKYFPVKVNKTGVKKNVQSINGTVGVGDASIMPSV